MVILDICTDKSIATLIIIMIASIVTNTEGNPVQSRGSHKKYWWHDPCDGRQKHSGRHTRDIPDALRTQINITYHTMLKIYNTHRTEIESLNIIPPRELVTKTKLRLNRMHSDIQHYAATLYQITNREVNSIILFSCQDVFMPLRDMKNTLKTLLCEIVTAINNKKKQPRVKKNVLPPSDKFYGNMDCSKAKMYRAMLIKGFTKVLEDLNRKYNRKKRRNNASKSRRNNSSRSTSQSI